MWRHSPGGHVGIKERMDLTRFIRDVPDFPEPGILFKDITPLLGDAKAFDHTISVEEVGYFKPHWKTYAKAEEILGDERAGILFVANHVFDCVGAKSYGFNTAFIDRRKQPFGSWPEQPDLIVTDLKELADALI